MRDMIAIQKYRNRFLFWTFHYSNVIEDDKRATFVATRNWQVFLAMTLKNYYSKLYFTKHLHNFKNLANYTLNVRELINFEPSIN